MAVAVLLLSDARVWLFPFDMTHMIANMVRFPCRDILNRRKALI